jgi:hypothetical protein
MNSKYVVPGLDQGIQNKLKMLDSRLLPAGMTSQQELCTEPLHNYMEESI